MMAGRDCDGTPINSSLCARRGRRRSPADRARRAYHARMLGYGLAPERKEFRPLVTILLPVHNRAGPLAEAVQSCIDQTWRPIEILVVDDGSTDDLRSALRHFGDQVRLIRKRQRRRRQRAQPRAARGAGRFHPIPRQRRLAVAARHRQQAVAAFDAVADAELCYGQSQWIDMRSSPPAIKPLHFRQHANPTRSLIVAFPFAADRDDAALAPAGMPPFEEDLRRSSDFRYWQCLGLAGIKVIGSRELVDSSAAVPRQPAPDAGAAGRQPRRGADAGTAGPGTAPQAWRYGAEYLNIVGAKRAQYWFWRFAIAIGFARPRPRPSPRWSKPLWDDPSPLPMFAAMAGPQRLKHTGEWPDEGAASIYRLLPKRSAAALGGAPPSTMTTSPFGRASRSSRKRSLPLPILRGHRAPLRATAAAPLANALLRAMPRMPARRTVRLVARLAGHWPGTRQRHRDALAVVGRAQR